MLQNDYDYVHIVPKGISTVSSREEPDLTTDFYGLYPLISSPMRGISGAELVIEMGKNNCLGILHRYDTPENRVKNIHKISESSSKPFGVAIGITDWDTEFDIATCAFENGAKMICVDIANGNLACLKTYGDKLYARFKDDVELMCGNVVTHDAAIYLYKYGFNFVRVGIGGSNVCATREVTGIGRNNLKAIHDCVYNNSSAYKIVADGGIDKPGKAVKAFVAGADYVMLGSALAYANEAEDKEGNLYGMASRKNHVDTNKTIKSIEGREFKIDVEDKKPLSEIIETFLWGIKSAATYLNVKNFCEFFNSGDFEPVSGVFGGYD